MPLQSTLRTGMSLWQTWRRATWVSLVRRTCWSSSYLTGSSCRAFWVSHSIWRSCFSWTTPANDLAWGGVLSPGHFCPIWESHRYEQSLFWSYQWASQGFPVLHLSLMLFLLILPPSFFPPTNVRPTAQPEGTPCLLLSLFSFIFLRHYFQ